MNIQMILDRVPEEFRESFYAYIHTGEASPGFLERLEADLLLDDLVNEALGLILNQIRVSR